MVKHLFSLGLDSHARGAGYNFTIYEAACRGDLDMVRFLIDHRAAPGTGIVFRLTGLDASSSLGPEADSTAVIPILLEEGIITEEHYLTLCHFSIQWGQLNLVKYYVERGRLDVRKKSPFLGASSLHLAILALENTDSLEMIKYFVELGCEILALDDNLETPVHLAVASGNFELVHYFIKQGVDVVSLAESGNQYVTGNFIEPEFEDPESPDGAFNVFGGGDDEDDEDDDLEDEEGRYMESIEKFRSNLPPSNPNSLNMEELVFNLNAFFDGGEILIAHPHPRTLLHCAAISGNPEMVQYILDMEMIDVNARNEKGDTPLIACLQNGKSENRLSIVQLLVQNGADFNARNSRGMSPLTLALSNDEPDVIDYLLSLDPALDKIGSNGETMLHWAARMGNINLAQRCVSEGISVNAKDSDGDPPLFEAATPEMVYFLLRQGADPMATNRRKQNVFFRNYPIDVLQMFWKKGCPIDATEKSGSTPLALAAKYADLEEVKFYIERGANVNSHNDQKETPLYFALKTFNWPVVKTLLDHGAVIIRGKKRDLPLVALARIGWLNAIKYFLDNKIYKNESEVVRAFHVAAKYGQKQIIEYMSQSGVDVNALNPKGETPIHSAFSGLFNGGVIETLLQRGAAVNARNRYGETLLHRAVSKRKLWAVRQLIRYGADVNAKRDLSLYQEKAESETIHFDTSNPLSLFEDLRTMITNHVEDSMRNSEDDENCPRGKALTPLLAALVGHSPSLNIVKALVEGGANPNGTDEFGSTPIHFAMFSEGFDFVRYLLDRGAKESINHQNQWGDTPLMWAARQESLEIVMYLVKHGADVTIRNAEGKTALEIAEECKNRPIAVYLRTLNRKRET